VFGRPYVKSRFSSWQDTCSLCASGANSSPVMAEPDSLGYIFTQH